MSHDSRYGGRWNGGHGDDQYRNRDHDRRSNRGEPAGDTYRPSSYRDDNRHYHGSDKRDGRDNRKDYPHYDSRDYRSTSYRDAGPPGVPPPPPPSYPQPPPPGRGDEYRPPQGDFSFRMSKPAGLQESLADSYRPNGDDQRQYRDGKSRHGARQRDTRRGRGRGSRGGYRGTFQRFKASDRAMLDIGQTDNAIEHSYYDEEAGATYRPLSDLSDTDEADMDISENEDSTDAMQEPSSKRARLGASPSAGDGDSVPKFAPAPQWSNPDPYTALPPPDANRQRKDVVQLIRKSRVQTKESRQSLPVETEDFIPCFDSDEEEGEQSENEGELNANGAGVPGAPTGPRLMQPSDQAAEGHTSIKVQAYTGTGTANSMSSTAIDSWDPNYSVNGSNPNPAPIHTLPPKPPVPGQSQSQLPQSAPADSDPALGTRKRTFDDEIKPLVRTERRVDPKMPSAGWVMPTWKAKKGEDPTPWLQHDHSNSPKIGVWLHKELVDWYDYVKPRDFEHDVRTQIVDELRSLVRRTYRNAEVYPFGSFPSGLYLPSADVDLAFLSDSTWNRGPADPRYTKKSFLYKLREFLVQKRLARRDDIELVIGAKVPIVKYIDQRTSTKVDISFEKVDGVHAVQTFLDWKAQYPVMPLLVTAIKHFLLMRGLNEPFNGGIGGFSVICLVVSMLQLMPEIQSRSMNPMHHVGELLLAFFDLYGNRFNYHTTAISLSPPGYIPKYQVQDFVYKRHDRLSIIDPNNPANDIAAGSSNFPKIVSAFSAAHRELRARMAYLSTASDAEKKDASILEVIFAGDYSSFRLHREHYAKLARQGIASLDSLPAAPPLRSQW